MAQYFSCVLDCSIALAWYFADEADPYADSVWNALACFPVAVPSLWPLEVANALVMDERRGRSTPAQAAAWLALLAATPHPCRRDEIAGLDRYPPLRPDPRSDHL